MRARVLVLIGLATFMLVAVATPAMAYDGLATSASCVGTCHSHAGYTDFPSWHASHVATPGLWCDTCHPNGHTAPTDSAPQTLFLVAEACNPCHISDAILPAHVSAGVTACSGCHPASVRKGTLAGFVTGPGGPLGGVTVTVSGSSPVLTAGDGSYSVAGIPAGLCTATFSKTGYLTVTAVGLFVPNAGTTVRNVVLAAAPPSDGTAPATVSDARPSYSGSAAIHLTAGDNLGGSGVAHTYYTVDNVGGPGTEGTSISIDVLGTHAVEFWSVDVAGNVETPRKSAGLTISAVPAGPEATSISIRSNVATTYVGRTAVLSGTVSPSGLVGVNIVVYVQKPGSARWTYSSNRTVYSAAGGASWLYKYYFKPGMAKGYYRFKASAPAPGFVSSAGWAASSSAVISVRVR